MRAAPALVVGWSNQPDATGVFWYTVARVVRNVLLVGLAVAAALALPGHAHAIGQCGLPSKKPIWGDVGSPALAAVFGKPGVVVGVSTGDFPAHMRTAGAKTVYWDMNLRNRVGTPLAPADPATLVERANRLFDFAAAQSGCAAPLIVLNELFGANLETPWSATNEKYRTNVLTFLRTLSERGARAFLLIPTRPFTAGEAGDWWREAARYADLVPEVYLAAPSLWKAGPIAGNRRIRLAMRRAIANFTALGIRPDRLGFVLGFQTGRGTGGREGLQPAEAWFEVVKWNALSAQQVARETGVGSVWSWGWNTYGASAHDPDKERAACVYLWTRDPKLCDGLAAAGPRFDPSRTAGQLRLRAGVMCSIGTASIGIRQLASLARVTGDREIAYTALLARAAEAPYAGVPTRRVLAAERAVISLRFRGSRAAYGAALRRAGATVALARTVLADELRRSDVEARLRARGATAREVAAFYTGYPDLPTRLVESKRPLRWLGDRKRGVALAELAPEAVFRLATGRSATLRGLDGPYAVRAVGETQPLGSVPLAEARPAIAAALSLFTRRYAFDAWSVGRQTHALTVATCRRDELPATATVRLSDYLPYLSLTAL